MLNRKSMKGYEPRGAFLGFGGVGKTSILQRLEGKPFNEKEPSTVGVDNKKVGYCVDDKLIIKFNFWDISVKSVREKQTTKILKGCECLFFVCALDEKKSLRQIDNLWLEFKDENAFKVLIANKNDLHNPDEFNEEIQKLKKKYKFDAYHSISAKTEKNLNYILKEVCQKLLENEQIKDNRPSEKYIKPEESPQSKVYSELFKDKPQPVILKPTVEKEIKLIKQPQISGNFIFLGAYLLFFLIVSGYYVFKSVDLYSNLD